MVRNLAGGCLVALGAAVVLLLGSGSDLERVALVGAALGGVLGLVREGGVGRYAGFALGFLLAWAGFALRAAALPDSSTGRAVAAVVVIGVCALVAALSKGRVPLWSMLLGCAAIVAAYENAYTNAPARFLVESPQAATTVLLAASVGALATSLAQLVERGSDRRTDGHDESTDPFEPHDSPQSRARHEARDDSPALDQPLGGHA